MIKVCKWTIGAYKKRAEIRVVIYWSITEHLFNTAVKIETENSYVRTISLNDLIVKFIVNFFIISVLGQIWSLEKKKFRKTLTNIRPTIFISSDDYFRISFSTVYTRHRAFDNKYCIK